MSQLARRARLWLMFGTIKGERVFERATTAVLARLNDIPFICIERDGDSYRLRGQAECTLGHIVSRRGSRPDGVYARWSWDGTNLTAENDRYGFYPLFYFADENRICLSPVIPRLLAEGSDRTIDDAALAVFLRLGYFLGDDTPFRNIRCLPPDAALSWSRTGLHLHSSLHLRHASPMSRESAIDGYIELFRQAVSRRPPTSSRFVLPLSGGRDSRHLFLELCERGWHPDHCVTVDLRHEKDSEVASQLAALEKVPLKVIPPAVPAIETELRRNLETSFCSDEHTWSLWLGDYLAESADCTYDGIGGDVLSASRFINPKRQEDFERGDFVSLARDLMGTNDRFTNTLLPSSVAGRWSTDAAIERVTAELKKYSNAANPMAAFIFWNRTRREIALYSYGVLRKTANVYAPFLDHDLYDHLASIPAAMQMDRKLHDDVIRRSYPRVAHIPFAGPTGAPPVEDAVQTRFADAALTYLFRADHKSWLRSGLCALGLLRSRLVPSRREDASRYGSRCMYMLQLEAASANGLLGQLTHPPGAGLLLERASTSSNRTEAPVTSR